MTLRMHVSLIESLELRQLFAAGFQIEMDYDSSVSVSVRTVLQQAVTKWQSIITGDIPDVSAGPWGAAVDDIRITASVVAIDGPGKGLAQAKPTFIRNGSHLPIAGIIQIDSADVGNSSLLSTVTHEIAHALGFGTIWSQFAGLTSGIGGSNPLFLGANALREYRTYAKNSALSGVPLENTGGAGTRDAHWREATFGNELLTGFLGAGANPLSRITIGSMADLGYQVNYNAADAYTLPGTTTTPPPAKGSISGKVFTDKNGDKVFETGEAGVANRAVYIDLNNNSLRDSNETEVFTDSNGNYTLSSLSANTYKVRIVRDGLTQTFPANNYGIGVTLTAGQNVTGQNFATVGSTTTTPPPPTSSTGKITGKVFNDTNKNGILDSSEGGLSGRELYLDRNNNAALDSGDLTAITDSSGNYTFSGVAVGTYVLRLHRGDLTQTSPGAYGYLTVAVTSGGTASGKNFGAYLTPASVMTLESWVGFTTKRRDADIDSIV